jgi:hypothetical protein
MWLSPDDPIAEIMAGKSNRPGFLYQIALRLFSPIDTGLIPFDDVHVSVSSEIFSITVLSLVLSIAAWLFFAVAIFVLLNRGIRGLLGSALCLTPSLTPAVAMWDRAIMSESFSISFSIIWIGSLALAVVHRNRLGWVAVSVFAVGAMLATRPSHLVIAIPVTAAVFLWLFRRTDPQGYLKPLALAIGALLLLSALAVPQFLRWSQKYESIVSSNRATSLLAFPAFEEKIASQGETFVCGSAIRFSERMWKERTYGFWGGVTEASKVEVEETGCLGSWRDLGDSSPSLPEILVSPELQYQYWTTGGAQAALNGRPALGSLTDDLAHGETMAGKASLLLGSEIYRDFFSAALLPLLFGIILSLTIRSRIRPLPRRVVGWSAIMFATSVGGMWLMALADGGDPYRHALPYNTLIPAFSGLVGFSILSSQWCPNRTKTLTSRGLEVYRKARAASCHPTIGARLAPGPDVNTKPRVKWLEPFKFFEMGYVTSILAPALAGAAEQQLLSDQCQDLLVVAGDRESPSVDARVELEHQPSAGFLVLSDEELKHKFRPYRKAQYVLRNYFQPAWRARNVYTLPLGYNSDFVGLREELPVQPGARANVWSFVGQLKQDRMKMLKALDNLGSHALYAAQSFNDPNGVRGRELFLVYSSSYFVLCPFGNRSPDSFRVMEALEAGAIPVTVEFLGTDHNRLVFGDHPFVVGRDWADARVLVEKLLSDSSGLEAKREEVSAWYDRYRAMLFDDVGKIMSGHRRADLASMQFRYQLRSSWNLVLQLKYFLYYSKRGRRLHRFFREAMNTFVARSGLGKWVRS